MSIPGIIKIIEDITWIILDKFNAPPRPSITGIDLNFSD